MEKQTEFDLKVKNHLQESLNNSNNKIEIKIKKGLDKYLSKNSQLKPDI